MSYRDRKVPGPGEPPACCDAGSAFVDDAGDEVVVEGEGEVIDSLAGDADAAGSSGPEGIFEARD